MDEAESACPGPHRHHGKRAKLRLLAASLPCKLQGVGFNMRLHNNRPRASEAGLAWLANAGLGRPQVVGMIAPCVTRSHTGAGPFCPISFAN